MIRWQSWCNKCFLCLYFCSRYYVGIFFSFWCLVKFCECFGAVILCLCAFVFTDLCHKFCFVYVCICTQAGKQSGHGQVSVCVCGHDVTLFQLGSLRGHDMLWTASMRTPGWDVYLACSPNTVSSPGSVGHDCTLQRFKKTQGYGEHSQCGLLKIFD